MIPDFPTLLVAVVFASQIITCSFISARRNAQAMQLMRNRFPPTEYPRLYPISADKMQRQHMQRMALRMGISGLAILVLVASLAQHAPAIALADRMIWIALAQMLPLLLLIPQQIHIARIIKAMPPPAVRTAELRSWRATDFVSPLTIAVAMLACLMPLALVLYLFSHVPPHGTNSLWVTAVVPLLLLGRMLYVLLAPGTLPRPDPYMSEPDLYRARQMRMRMLFRMAIFMGVYVTFIQLWAAGLMPIDKVFVSAGVSVLIQLTSLRVTGMLRDAIENRDFTPYRAEAASGA